MPEVHKNLSRTFFPSYILFLKKMYLFYLKELLKEGKTQRVLATGSSPDCHNDQAEARS